MLTCKNCTTLRDVISQQQTRIRELEMTQLALIDKAAYRMVAPKEPTAPREKPSEVPAATPAEVRHHVFQPPVSFGDARAAAEAEENAG